MEAIILAAGEGSRMGDVTKDLPKAFLDISGKKLYRHQIEQLSPYCDKITVILGHGFETESTPSAEFSLDGLEPGTQVEFKVIRDWKTKENAYSALVGLQDVHDDVFLICGDVIFTQKVISQIASQFNNQLETSGYSGVGVIEGIQNEMTAVRWDDDGVITNYGAIEGHQEVGIFVLNGDHISQARKILEKNPTDWFPIIFQEVPSKAITVDEEERHEINTPQQLNEARKKWSKLTQETPAKR